jgi:hypothetical protein
MMSLTSKFVNLFCYDNIIIGLNVIPSNQRVSAMNNTRLGVWTRSSRSNVNGREEKLPRNNALGHQGELRMESSVHYSSAAIGYG